MIYYFFVSFALGIIFERLVGAGFVLALFLILLCLVSLFILRKEKKSHFGILIILFFSFGILRLATLDNAPNPNLQKMIGQKIEFEGVIVNEPDKRDNFTRYVVSIDKFNQAKILITADRFPEFKYGDQISVSGKIENPKNFLGNDGNYFDYVSFLEKDRIHFVSFRPNIKKVGEGRNFFLESLYNFKNVFIKKIAAVLPEPNSSLIAGMIFGSKQSLGEKLLEDFKKVGLIHLVVLSGYNLTVIATAIFYLTSYTNKRKFSLVFALVGILVFAVMVGLSATVVRASIMALIAIAARYLGRPVLALRTLFLTGFLMLISNPLTLTSDPSFQLSFLATLGLILYSPIIHDFLTTKIYFLSRNSVWQEILASTLAAQFFVLPMLTKMTGSISLISFLANLLVSPLVPYAMLFGFLTGLFGFVPFLGIPFAWLSGSLAFSITKIIILITEVGATLPFVTLKIETLSIWLTIIWYGFYAFVYLRLKKQKLPNLSI
jgi:competence protein ComEC